MSGGALRVLFAELGFDIDEAALDRAEAKVKDVARQMNALVPASEAGGGAVRQAARAADAALRETAQAAQATAKEVAASIETQFLDIEGMREAMAEARDEGMKAAQAGPSVVVSDELKEEIAQLEAAAAATRKLAEEEKKRREAPALRARNERADNEAQAAFDASAEGQAHAAWKRGADNTRALQAPVTSLGAATERTQGVIANAFGRVMPASVQRFAERLGFARGDTLSLGRAIVDVSRRSTMALAALVVGIGAFTTSFAAESEALREAAREARVTSSELQALQHAGAQSGVGADRVTQSVTALGQKLRDANNHLPGSGGTVALLRRLGISARDASGQIRPTVDILDDVAVAMEHVSSPRRRIRIAETLGLDRRMLEIMHTGAGGIRALRDEMRALGGGVTPEATEAARRFTQQQERARVALTSVRSSIFTQLAPSLTDLVRRGAELLGWFARMTRGTHVFENAAKLLGVALVAAAGPALIAWSPMIATFAAIAAVVTALAIAWDDVQHLLEGQPSLIGDLIDRYAGFGASARFVERIRDAWNGVVDAIVRMNEAIERFPAWARHLIDAGTFGLRAFVPDRSAGGDATPGAANDPPGGPPAHGARRAGTRGERPAQPRMPAANLGAWQGVQAGNKLSVAVPIPAMREVAVPGAAAPTVHQVTHNNAGDRNTFNLSGNTAEIQRMLVRVLDERERQRNAQRSSREAE